MRNLLKHNTSLTLLINFVLLFYSSDSLAQTKAEIFDQIFSKYHEYENFQGVVLVAEAGEVLYREAFGLANREWNIPNQVDAKFNIASISKQFTAALIMQLVEEDKIHLDSTISVYYPEYRRDIGQQVTIHHLLTHRSGIPNYTSIPYVWSDSLQNKYTKEALVKKFCSNNLEFKPGSRYQYNNTGYFLLSMIIEKVTGKEFATVLKEKILDPLGLKNTAVDNRESVLLKRAYGYEREGEHYNNVSGTFMQNLQGAGNLYSTVDDLFAWNQAFTSGQVLSAGSVEVMQTPYSEESAVWISPYTNNYGYGIGLADIPLAENEYTKMIFHSGHIKGFSGYVASFIEEGNTIILLSNVGNVSTVRMNEIAQQVKNVLYGLPYEIPERSLAPELIRVIASQGVDAAIEHFYKLKDAFPYEFKNVSKDLDQLGLALMQEDKIPEALEIFKLNVKMYPNWMTYQRLGFAYMQNNDAREAAKNYRKAISLNPKRSGMEKRAHAEAKQMLKSIQ